VLIWDEICAIEPRLKALGDLAKTLERDWQYKNYETMKNRMYPLVGMEAQNPALRGSEAWDVAMENIAMHCAP